MKKTFVPPLFSNHLWARAQSKNTIVMIVTIYNPFFHDRTSHTFKEFFFSMSSLLTLMCLTIFFNRSDKSAHEQDLPPRVKWATPTNEILSRIRTFSLGPFGSNVKPVAGRVVQNLEIISKTFSTDQNSAHEIYDSYQVINDKTHENPGTLGIKLKVLKNTLQILCYPIGCQFNSIQSHLILSPIGARTLKMPVPYPPSIVVSYTRTPSHHHLCSAGGAQITSLRSDDLVVPNLPACGCEWWRRLVSPSKGVDWRATCHNESCAWYGLRCSIGVSPWLCVKLFIISMIFDKFVQLLSYSPQLEPWLTMKDRTFGHELSCHICQNVAQQLYKRRIQQLEKLM